MMNHHQAQCPRCLTSLDEGPVVYRCSRCRRAVPAADLDTEYCPPTLRAAA
jgi:tRNA(Ile2) C34 agmatinyltransferase TiaS